MNRKAFSLVELLVVLALIGILTTLRYRYSKPKASPQEMRAVMREYPQYPRVVQRNLAVLKNWVKPLAPGFTTGVRSLAGTQETALATLNDVAAGIGLGGKRIQLMAYSGDGSAVIAGGLLVFEGWTPAGVLLNNGNWRAFPSPRTEKPGPKYFNQLAFAGVWRRASEEKVVTVMMDTSGDARTSGVTETLHFFVDGVQWPAQLKRSRDVSRIDGLQGQIRSPEGATFNYEGKIPRDFLDSGNMPSFKLAGEINAEPVIPLLCYFCG